jgi:hypothetical protein
VAHAGASSNAELGCVCKSGQRLDFKTVERLMEQYVVCEGIDPCPN